MTAGLLAYLFARPITSGYPSAANIRCFSIHCTFDPVNLWIFKGFAAHPASVLHMFWALIEKQQRPNIQHLHLQVIRLMALITLVVIFAKSIQQAAI